MTDKVYVVNLWLKQLSLIRFVSRMHLNCKAMTTNDTMNYSCHTKPVALVKLIIWA